MVNRDYIIYSQMLLISNFIFGIFYGKKYFFLVKQIILLPKKSKNIAIFFIFIYRKLKIKYIFIYYLKR